MRLNVTKRMRISCISLLVHSDPLFSLAFTNKKKNVPFHFLASIEAHIILCEWPFATYHNTANDFGEKKQISNAERNFNTR